MDLTFMLHERGKCNILPPQNVTSHKLM